MKAFLRIVCILGFIAITSRIGFAEMAAAEATICDLTNKPQEYSGKIVRIAAEWTRSAQRILLDDPMGQCGPILGVLASDSGIHPRPHFSLVRDAELNTFLQSAYVLIPNAVTHKKGKIKATLLGRFDAARPGRGFGHEELYDFRLVIQKVSAVSVEKGDDLK